MRNDFKAFLLASLQPTCEFSTYECSTSESSKMAVAETEAA